MSIVRYRRFSLLPFRGYIVHDRSKSRRRAWYDKQANCPAKLLLYKYVYSERSMSEKTFRLANMQNLKDKVENQHLLLNVQIKPILYTHYSFVAIHLKYAW